MASDYIKTFDILDSLLFLLAFVLEIIISTDNKRDASVRWNVVFSC